MLILELSATVLGLLQGLLVLLNKRSNWIFYIAQMICLISFSLLNRLFGDAVNNSIYLVMGIAGFIMWKRGVTRQITVCSTKERLFYIGFIGLGTLIVSLVLRLTADPLPLTDAFTTVSSLTATYYMVRRKTDTWLIWFVNDIFYVFQYGKLENPAYSLMALNVIWTVMAIVSYWNWNKILKGYGE